MREKREKKNLRIGKLEYESKSNTKFRAGSGKLALPTRLRCGL